MPPSTEPRESLRFSKSVGAGNSGSQSYDVPVDATVERLVVRIYRGAELDLHITPWIKPGGGERKVDLVQFKGKSYIDGDGDKWEFDVGEAVTQGDQIGVDYDNKDSTYSYDYAVHVELDKEGGTARAMGLVDRLKGVF